MVLLQLTENDKRLIFAFFLILILVFVIIGVIGYLVVRVMKAQSVRIDDKVYDVVTTRVITEKKEFKKYAHRKNWHMFYKSAQIPIIILLCAGLCVLIHYIVNNFDGTSLFDARKGFSTLLFLWDYEGTPTTSVMGVTVWSEWPKLYEDIGSPQFVLQALPSYLAVPGFAIGVIWYLVEVQALIARGLRIRKLSNQVFAKSLEGFNLNQQMTQQMNAQQAPQQSPQQQGQVQNDEMANRPDKTFRL